jgi:2-keto-4-pentenoate hydratase/2-oxohepta-3-ene-1,7-dioic acid hydratase in catechol pathway
MRFVRYGVANEERPGILDSSGRLRSLFPLISDFTVDMLTPEWLDRFRSINIEKLPLVPDEPRLGAPVAGLRQILAIGMNYRDHVKEGGGKVPEYPVVFAKSVGSLSGGDDAILIPDWAKHVDWEIELAFFIGKAAREVSAEEALGYVAGYCTAIDLSERRLQNGPGGQLGHGKSLDSFTPLGPWFVTAEEISDPQALNLWLEVNGKRLQNGNTRDMVFPVAAIISHLSRYQTLLPGDLVLTGTPAGVGHTTGYLIVTDLSKLDPAMKPPTYLRPGDKVACGVEGLGIQRHDVARRA